MDLYKTKNDAIFEASKQYALAIEEGLKARFTHVKVINNTGKSGNLSFSLEFKFHGSDVRAVIDGGIIRPSNYRFTDPADMLRFVNNHTTIEGMESELAKRFAAHLGERARNLQQKLQDGYEGLGLKKEQKIYMLQQDYIDEGFDATIIRLANNKLKMIIGHELLKRPLCELTLD